MTYTPVPNDDELQEFDGLDDSFAEEAPIRRKRRRRKKSFFNKLRKQVGVKRIKTRGILITIVAMVTVISVGGFALFFDSANRVQASLRGLQRVVSSVGGRSGTDLTLADFERLQRSITDLQVTLNDTLRRLA